MSAPIRLGWHFLPADGKLANGDGRRPRVGRWLTYNGPIVPCRSGLHWSPRTGERVLRAFARQCAADVLPMWGCPVPAVVVRWLATGDDDLRVAARVAAWVAARVAAWAAARVAAWAAATAAAGDAARGAAWVAAWGAALAADGDGAGAEQNARLEAWLTAAHEGRWGEIVVTIPDGVEVEP